MGMTAAPRPAVSLFFFLDIQCRPNFCHGTYFFHTIFAHKFSYDKNIFLFFTSNNIHKYMYMYVALFQDYEKIIRSHTRKVGSLLLRTLLRSSSKSLGIEKKGIPFSFAFLLDDKQLSTAQPFVLILFHFLSWPPIESSRTDFVQSCHNIIGTPHIQRFSMLKDTRNSILVIKMNNFVLAGVIGIYSLKYLTKIYRPL